ncbi:hypothetical protein PAAL109150_22010 [Paenibacillus alkaliterrae]
MYHIVETAIHNDFGVYSEIPLLNKRGQSLRHIND